jgi:hypothetical protein
MLLVTTTRTVTLDMSAFRDARRALVRALRRLGRVEYSATVEYTGGYAERSGGERRPHWNWMLKGLGDELVGEAREMAIGAWCRFVDAEPVGQYAELIRDVGGLMPYLQGHFVKASQSPPIGFQGQRFNCSRGYFGGVSVMAMRQRAAESVRRKQLLWKLEQQGVSDVYDRELLVHQALELSARTTWELVNDRGARVAGLTRDRRRTALTANDAGVWVWASDVVSRKRYRLLICSSSTG